MNTVIIKDGNTNIVLELVGNKFNGYIFYPNNTYQPADNKVLKYFDFLKLSNNQVKLPNEGKYQVILDKETNYKHYFYNNKEDFRMFYYNNGVSAVSYDTEEENDDDSIRNKLKEFHHKNAKIYLSFILVLSIGLGYIVGATVNLINDNYQKRDLTIEEVRNAIYSSSKLTNEQKDLLYNEDLAIKSIAEINKSEYAKYYFRKYRLYNRGIVYYKGAEDSKTRGHQPYNSRDIYIDERCCENPKYELCVIKHEDGHWWQMGNEYRIIDVR